MMLDNRQRCTRAARHVRSPRPPATHTHTHTYNFPVDHPFLPLQMLHLWGTVVVWRRLQRWLSLRAAAITIVPTTVTTPANEPVQTRGATALHTRLFLLSLTPSPPHPAPTVCCATVAPHQARCRACSPAFWSHLAAPKITADRGGGAGRAWPDARGSDDGGPPLGPRDGEGVRQPFFNFNLRQLACLDDVSVFQRYAIPPAPCDILKLGVHAYWVRIGACNPT